MEKKLVKYDNKFNLTNLNELSKIEQDIFMTICSRFSKEKVERIEIPYEVIKADADLSLRKYTNKKFKEFMIVTQSKILRLNFSVQTEEGLKQRPLFREFFTPNKGECTIAQLDDLFLQYLYDIPQKIAFSQFELDCFLVLKSKYSKTLLRFLLQNFTGKWTIDWQDFCIKMGFPQSHKTSMRFLTLNKAINELNKTDLVSNIHYEVTKKRSHGSPIDKITFIFEINKQKKMELEGQTTIEEYNYSTVTETKTKTAVIDPITTISHNTENKPITSGDFEFYKPIYNEPVIIQTETTTEEKAESCPNCGSAVIIKETKTGKMYKCCENNAYWKLGNANCDWVNYDVEE